MSTDSSFQDEPLDDDPSSVDPASEDDPRLSDPLARPDVVTPARPEDWNEPSEGDGIPSDKEMPLPND
ncbi:hypothetical protein [Pseudomonas sp. RA_35y_Pfl2_P32]|uniref:hypothetical protein n=1 Tax=Pseudomonas sp. RA_35y_Pfl2_P32 TaxID=3088705 RepID=UPI0030DC111F